ncbi:MAG: cytochrome C [Flavobacteriaceae bacterium]|nr:MAG: cytochrome C [Flavobacteriaceae bacterium]
MKIKFLSIVAIAALMTSCSGDKPKADVKETTPVKKEVKQEAPAKTEVVSTASFMDDKGVGPITSIELGELDTALAGKGKAAYKSNGCISCHKISKRFVGPALKGVTQRRSPEWIMNMILDPEGMVANNEAARQLLAEYSAPMANQNVSEEDARAILEYFRTKN